MFLVSINEECILFSIHIPHGYLYIYKKKLIYENSKIVLHGFTMKNRCFRKKTRSKQMPLHITTYNISTMKKTTNQIKTFGLELNLLTYPFLIGECRDYKQKNVAGSHNHPWGVLDWFRGKTHQIFIFWNAVPPTSILRNFFQSPELKLWQLPRVYTRSVHFGTGFRRPPSSPGNFLIKNKNQPIIALLSHYIDQI